jgi:hypothetical protein
VNEGEPKLLRDQREDASVMVLVDEEKLFACTTRKGDVGDRRQTFVPWSQVDHAAEAKKSGVSLIEHKQVQLVRLRERFSIEKDAE